MKQGTPQGSTLSGLVFALYLNDLPEKLSNSKSLFYADDLGMHASAETIPEVESKLQSDVDALESWCSENGMKINTQKTKSMLFHRKKLSESDRLDLKTSENKIEYVKEFKYLGLSLDQKLSFNAHYEKVCSNMTSRLYMLKRYAKYFSFKWRHIFCTSLVLSVLEYCLPVWGTLSEGKLDRINCIILKLAKYVVLDNNYNKKVLSDIDIIDKLNWLLCQEKISVYTLNFIFKHVTKTSSLNMCLDNFVKRESTGRGSKLEHNFFVPRMNTTFGKSSFLYRGITIWNKLPNSIKEIDNFKKFDLAIRKSILMERKNDMIYFH
ncbi:unnamed protein product [Orchesella dallaii]|uniref:Reverse transcriptase domain-containing protein n=1 Tax=Orchesella dallaii TaxID=48710 RepID=A0ABP1Q7R3_9HEXA